ncbi:hypothetical protein RJ641_024936 [Dillenia turbinata]|uniref:Uncharacterized protein n=1 Tax=Dillenia turbinata TaxID=194707 RepID=A0AAN8W5X5_9MAGN
MDVEPNMSTESYYTSGRKIEDAGSSWSQSTHCKGATTLSLRKRKSYVLDQSHREIPWGMPCSSAVQNGKHVDKNMLSPTSKKQKTDKKQMSGSLIGSEGYKHCISSVLSLSKESGMQSNINCRNLDRNEKVGEPGCGVSKRKFLDACKFRELFTRRSRKDMLLDRPGKPEATHQSPKEGMLCSLPTETRTFSEDSTAERSMCLKWLKMIGPPKGNPQNEASSGSLSLKPDKEFRVISEESKRENDAMETTAEEREIAICLEHLKKADTSSGGPKNVASSGNLSLEPDRECQIVSEESRRENDAVETTAVEREIAICLDQLNKTYTSKGDLDTPLWTPTPGPEIDAQVIFDESKRETGMMERTAAVKETVLSHGQLHKTDTSNDDPKKLALSENLSPEPNINPKAVSYGIKPSETSQTVQNEHADIKPSEASQTVQNEHVDIQNLNELAVTENPIGTRSEVHDENVAEVGHHNTRIPPISSEQLLIGPSRDTLLPSSQLCPYSFSSVHQPICRMHLAWSAICSSNVDISMLILFALLPQSTACTNSHAEHNWHNLPARLGLYTYNSNEMHTSSERAQALPLRPSRCIPLDGSNAHLATCRSTTVPDSAVAPFLSFSVRPEMSLPVCTNSLQNEMQRIEKDKEQAIKCHEDLVLHLNSERQREIDKVQKKFDALLQDAEVALSQKRKDFETNYNKVYLNNFLAKVFSEKHKNSHAAGSQEAASITVIDLLELMLRQTEQIVTPGLGHSLPNISRVSSNVSPPVHIINNSSHLLPTRDNLNCESGQILAQRPERSPANMPTVGTSAAPPVQTKNISTSALQATQDKPNYGSKFRPSPLLSEAYFTTFPGQQPLCSLSAGSSQLTSCLPAHLSELCSVNQMIKKMGEQLPISQSSLEMYLGVDFVAHILNSGPMPRSDFSF